MSLKTVGIEFAQKCNFTKQKTNDFLKLLESSVILSEKIVLVPGKVKTLQNFGIKLSRDSNKNIVLQSTNAFNELVELVIVKNNRLKRYSTISKTAIHIRHIFNRN